RPLKSETASSTTASPSMTNCVCRFFSALDDPRLAAAPIVAVTGEQAHAIAVADDCEPVAVVFDFVEPVGGRRNDLAAGRKAGRIGASHAPRYAFGSGITPALPPAFRTGALTRST